jgi:hypothetical protein
MHGARPLISIEEAEEAKSGRGQTTLRKGSDVARKRSCSGGDALNSDR